MDYYKSELSQIRTYCKEEKQALNSVVCVLSDNCAESARDVLIISRIVAPAGFGWSISGDTA